MCIEWVFRCVANTARALHRGGARAVLLAVVCVLTNPTGADPFYLVSSSSGAIHKYGLDGQYLSDLVPAGTNQLGNPQHMVVGNGKVYVPGYANGKLSQIDLATGTIEHQWSLGAAGTAFARWSEDGSELWVSAINSNRILRIDPATGAVNPTDLVAPGSIPGPHGIIDGPGNSLYVAGGNNSVYQIDANASVSNVLSVSASPRPTNMLMLNDGSLLVGAFTGSSSNSLRRYDLQTGADLGQFSGTQGVQADGLIRGHSGEIFSVFWGSGSIARYNDAGDFLGYFAAPGSGLFQPNHIVLVPSPSSLLVVCGLAIHASQRRR